MRPTLIVVALLFALPSASAIADAGSAAGSATPAPSPQPAGSGSAGSAAPAPAVGAGSGSAAPAGSEPTPGWATDDAPTAPAAAPSIESNPGGFLHDAYGAATSKRWALLAGFALLALVWLARHGAIKLVPWFATTTGGVFLAFGISACGTLGLALGSGAKVTPDLFVSAATTAATAAGMWQWISKRFPSTSKRIDAAKKAAKAPTDKPVA